MKKRQYKVCKICGVNKPRASYNSCGEGSVRPECSSCRNLTGSDRYKKTKTKLNRKCSNCFASICPTSKSGKCRKCAYIGENSSAWNGGRIIGTKGYIYVYSPNHPNKVKKVYVAEHRLVMEKHIGRYLLKSENVHHKNGNKQDNRIENLELWNTSQPAGQRPEDKVMYALEILGIYNPEYLTEHGRKLGLMRRKNKDEV